jgi:hypothetical protein
LKEKDSRLSLKPSNPHSNLLAFSREKANPVRKEKPLHKKKRKNNPKTKAPKEAIIK